jgi:predicted transcriptional regulator
MENKIERNRHYIYTYTLLSGGNPRLILFLYELLLDNLHLDTEKILGKIMELTPYFLDKTRDESPQRKLILDVLATGPPAQTATEIGDYINAGPKSVTEQLKRLEAEGWIKQVLLTGKGVKQKEVFYVLGDYFYRVWYQVRMKGIYESDIYCMSELAAILFHLEEAKERLKNHTQSETTGEKKFFYQKALELSAAKESISLAFIEDLMTQLNKEDIETSEVILKIIGAVKNPGTREAQQWMVDPLFKLIVSRLSKSELRHSRDR